MLILNKNILTIGGNRLEGGHLTPPVPPTDPYNPLGLPPNTVRVRTNDGNVPSSSSCLNVQSGALALYQQASSQTNPPSSHNNTFYNCGKFTTTGAAELAQIPSDWGGTGA